MRRCEDEKMRYRPPLLEEPCAQTLSGKNVSLSVSIYSVYIYIYDICIDTHDIDIFIYIYASNESPRIRVQKFEY